MDMQLLREDDQPIDIQSLWNNEHTNALARAWFFNNISDDVVKIMVFNIPLLIDADPVVHYALNISAKQVLEVFQTSLNDDGHSAVDEIIQSGQYTSYIEAVTEIAVANTFYEMESILYDDGGFIEYDYGLNVSSAAMMEYITENIIAYQNRVSQFAFIVFTSVITAIVSTVTSLKAFGANIDTYELKRSMSNDAVVNVACYIDRTAGFIAVQE